MQLLTQPIFSDLGFVYDEDSMKSPIHGHDFAKLNDLRTKAPEISRVGKDLKYAVSDHGIRLESGGASEFWLKF
jgi:hypothetical protein